MGRSSFAILLFQDIAVIPIMAILPLLADGTINKEHISHALTTDLEGWLQTLIVFGAIGMVYIGGRFLIVPLLHVVDQPSSQQTIRFVDWHFLTDRIQ